MHAHVNDAEIAALLARARATTESNTLAPTPAARAGRPLWVEVPRTLVALVPLLTVIAIATILSGVL